MCVRTKTSYGCGHNYKQDQYCHQHSCAGLERYHFEEEGDCRQCRRGGKTVSRGREGQGRYARELYKKEYQSSTIQTPLSPSLHHLESSPWAPSSRREKDWRSPLRKQADEAWEEEHSRREEDLQSRSQDSGVGTVHSAASGSPYGRRGRNECGAAIREEIRKIEDSERIRVRRRRERQPSYDSFDSFGESFHSHHSNHHSSGHRSHESGRSRTCDSGFHSSKHNPYNLYNTESYFSGLGNGLGGLVKDSTRTWVPW